MAEDFRVSLSREAHMGLTIESSLRGKSMRALAAELILQGISPEARQFVEQQTEVN